jgi:hypothetical protein
VRKTKAPPMRGSTSIYSGYVSSRQDAQNVYGQAAISVRASEGVRIGLMLLQELPNLMTHEEAKKVDECIEELAVFSERVARKVRMQKGIVEKMAHLAEAAETWVKRLPEFTPETEVDKLLPLMHSLQAASKSLNKLRDEKVKLASNMEMEHTKTIKQIRSHQTKKQLRSNPTKTILPTKKELEEIIMDNPKLLLEKAAQEIKKHEDKKRKER